MQDYFNVKNTLKVDTPYAFMKIIKSRYSHTYEPGRVYASELNFEVLNHTNWLEVRI